MKHYPLLLLICLSLSLQSGPIFAVDQSGEPEKDPALIESVTSFWKAQQTQDRVTAMRHVHPDDLNVYLNQKPARILKWEIDKISRESDSESAEVKINYVIETYPGTSFNAAKIDRWQRLDGVWKVRVKNPSSDAMEALFAKVKSKEEDAPREGLIIEPKTIKFFKLNLKQPALIRIENNLDSPARISNLEFNPELIEVQTEHPSIPPGETVTIRLHYIGEKPKEENLETTVRIEVTAGETTVKKEIKVIYNYMNDAMRWIQQQRSLGKLPR